MDELAQRRAEVLERLRNQNSVLVPSRPATAKQYSFIDHLLATRALLPGMAEAIRKRWPDMNVEEAQGYIAMLKNLRRKVER